MSTDFFERWPGEEQPEPPRWRLSTQDRLMVRVLCAILGGAAAIGSLAHFAQLNVWAGGVLLLVTAAFVALWQWAGRH